MKKLLIALVATMLMIVPAMAMDTISDSDLDGISGQAGVTVGFGGAQTTTVTWAALSWGDPDGYSLETVDGFFIVQGTISVGVSIAAGQTLAIDVATATGTFTENSVVIPTGETFVALSLPTQTVTVTTPANGFTLGLGGAAGTITGTIGILDLDNLSVTVVQPSKLYIWAHN